MTKEQIQDRVKVLEQAILIHQGAIQDCNYWLQELERVPVANSSEEVNA